MIRDRDCWRRKELPRDRQTIVVGQMEANKTRTLPTTQLSNFLDSYRRNRVKLTLRFSANPAAPPKAADTVVVAGGTYGTPMGGGAFVPSYDPEVVFCTGAQVIAALAAGKTKQAYSLFADGFDVLELNNLFDVPLDDVQLDLEFIAEPTAGVST